MTSSALIGICWRLISYIWDQGQKSTNTYGQKRCQLLYLSPLMWEVFYYLAWQTKSVLRLLLEKEIQ